MKITMRHLNQLIREVFTTVSDEEFDKITMPGYKPPHPGHGDADGDGVKDFADSEPYIDLDLVNRLMDIIEDHDGKARFDGRYIIGIGHATDRHGKAIQDIEKFDATLQRKTLIRKIRLWLGY